MADLDPHHGHPRASDAAYWKEEVDRLRARLAEVEAELEEDQVRIWRAEERAESAESLLAVVESERDRARQDAVRDVSYSAAQKLHQMTEKFVARLAEVEAERDGWKLAADHRTELHGELVERLAEVEARCQTVLSDPYPYSARGAAHWVLAAARGEGR